jgi:hypothetical protein
VETFQVDGRNSSKYGDESSAVTDASESVGTGDPEMLAARSCAGGLLAVLQMISAFKSYARVNLNHGIVTVFDSIKETFIFS